MPELNLTKSGLPLTLSTEQRRVRNTLLYLTGITDI